MVGVILENPNLLIQQMFTERLQVDSCNKYLLNIYSQPFFQVLRWYLHTSSSWNFSSSWNSYFCEAHHGIYSLANVCSGQCVSLSSTVARWEGMFKTARSDFFKTSQISGILGKIFKFVNVGKEFS